MNKNTKQMEARFLTERAMEEISYLSGEVESLLI